MKRVYRLCSSGGAILGLGALIALLKSNGPPVGIAAARFYPAHNLLVVVYTLINLGLGLGLFWPKAMRSAVSRIAHLARRLHLLGPLLFAPVPLLVLTCQVHPALLSIAPLLIGWGVCLVGTILGSVLSPEAVRDRWHLWTARRLDFRSRGRALAARLKTSSAGDRVHWGAVAFVLLASIAPRAANLRNVMLYDEAVTFLYYAQDLWTAITAYDRPNNHFLHTVLVHFSTLILGDGEAAIRLPAFLASILGLGAVYLLGRRLFNRHVGLWAMALTGLSPWLMQYSYNARGYTLVVFLTTLALAWLVMFLEGKGSLIAVEAALVPALYTIPTTAYFCAALAVFALSLWLNRRLFSRGPDPAPLGRLLLALAAWTGLLYLNPFFWRWLRGYSLYPSDVGLRRLDVFFAFLGQNIFAVTTGPLPVYVGIGVVLLILGAAAVRLIRTRPAAFGLIACILGVPPALVAIQAATGMNIPTPRALLFTVTVIYVLAAGGIYVLLSEVVRRLHRVGLRWRSPLPGLGPALIALLIFALGTPQYLTQFVPYDQRPNYQDEGHKVREIARYLAAAVEPGDAIFIEACCISAPVRYYLPPDIANAHWDAVEGAERVFFVPGVWVTLDVFYERYGDRFQLVGPVATIGDDTIYLFKRQRSP